MARGCAATKRPLPGNRRSAPARCRILIAGLPTACISQRRREYFMSLPEDDAAALSARWTAGALLKRDVFSTVERGRFPDGHGPLGAGLPPLDHGPRRTSLPGRPACAPES